MPRQFTVHSSLLFDPRIKDFVQDVSITVNAETGSIVHVYERSTPLLSVPEGDVDLRGKVVMPGFVDAHTHIFLHSYEEHSPTGQMRDESVVERVVRATNHLRAALLSGFTTYRDLGTEGVADCDANLRDCVNRGLVPGPRLFVATHPIASTDSYKVHTENALEGGTRVRLPPISDAADGPVGIRRAVRRRVAAGADIIKFYADYRRKIMRFPPPHGDVDIRFPPTDAERNPSVPLFSQDEMDAIVAEAKLAKLPVAAHAQTAEGAWLAVRAGATSLEHGLAATGELFQLMKEKECIYVPTLAVYERNSSSDDFATSLRTVKHAFDAGVRFAVGGDTGAFPHGEGAREMELLIEAGVPVEDVLEACTVGGWEACGRDGCGYRFGWFEAGCRADIIALETDPREDSEALRKVDFVMKDGEIWKEDGLPVGMMAQLMRETRALRPPTQDGDWELV